ncbi:MAG TPA: carbamoyl phosphate synthase small subunit, partial [Trueperaceae bacterium]|nr:carbamoyl phosphate synthase small subunit [Trueperaceae bacterium]
DGSVEGITVAGKPVFGIQYHPEASPGPHDSSYLFTRFIEEVNSFEGATALPAARMAVGAG